MESPLLGGLPEFFPQFLESVESQPGFISLNDFQVWPHSVTKLHIKDIANSILFGEGEPPIVEHAVENGVWLPNDKGTFPPIGKTHLIKSIAGWRAIVLRKTIRPIKPVVEIGISGEIDATEGGNRHIIFPFDPLYSEGTKTGSRQIHSNFSLDDIASSKWQGQLVVPHVVL